MNWKGALFVICCWDIPQYGGCQDWTLFQIKVLSFCQRERSNKQCLQLWRQRKGWFLRDACPVISVRTVSRHSTYLKNIKPFKRAQAAFWSHCCRIFSSFSFPQPGKSDPLTPSCWSRQSHQAFKTCLWPTGYVTQGLCPNSSCPAEVPFAEGTRKRGESHAQEPALLSSGALLQIHAFVPQELLPKIWPLVKSYSVMYTKWVQVSW